MDLGPVTSQLGEAVSVFFQDSVGHDLQNLEDRILHESMSRSTAPAPVRNRRRRSNRRRDQGNSGSDRRLAPTRSPAQRLPRLAPGPVGGVAHPPGSLSPSPFHDVQHQQQRGTTNAFPPNTGIGYPTYTAHTIDGMSAPVLSTPVGLAAGLNDIGAFIPNWAENGSTGDLQYPMNTQHSHPPGTGTYRAPHPGSASIHGPPRRPVSSHSLSSFEAHQQASGTNGPPTSRYRPNPGL